MILRQVGDYLKQRGEATLADIALHVDADESAVLGMLDQWINKGLVERRALASGCGSSCSKCEPAQAVLYVWRAGARVQEQPLPFPSINRV